MKNFLITFLQVFLKVTLIAVLLVSLVITGVSLSIAYYKGYPEIVEFFDDLISSSYEQTSLVAKAETNLLSSPIVINSSDVTSPEVYFTVPYIDLTVGSTVAITYSYGDTSNTVQAEVINISDMGLPLSAPAFLYSSDLFYFGIYSGIVLPSFTSDSSVATIQFAPIDFSDYPITFESIVTSSSGGGSGGNTDGPMIEVLSSTVFSGIEWFVTSIPLSINTVIGDLFINSYGGLTAYGTFIVWFIGVGLIFSLALKLINFIFSLGEKK